MYDKEFVATSEDLIRKYVSKRKTTCESDIKDLLRCLVLYLQKETGDSYAFNIDYIGVMYRKLEDEEESLKNSRYLKMLKDSFYNHRRAIPLVTNRSLHEMRFPNKTIQEIQQIQNATED